jgi:hypothetical protein
MKTTLFNVLIILVILTGCTNSGRNNLNSIKVVKKTPSIDSLINADRFNRSDIIELEKLSNLDFYDGYRGLRMGMSLDSINLNSGFETNDVYSSKRIKILQTSDIIKNNLLWGYINLTFYDTKLRVIRFKSYSDAASGSLIKMFGKPNIVYFTKSNRDSLIKEAKNRLRQSNASRSSKSGGLNLDPAYATFDGEYRYSNYIWRTEKIELYYSDTVTISISKGDFESKATVKTFYNSNLIFFDLKYKELINQTKREIDDSLRKALFKKSEKNFIQHF